ncbi:MAG: zinc-dependent dehydrogenase [Candidatus Omnitrophica bacterium]|nr:zinc-dependent dehydrogenase [Candidatus Omnitrophota bacterium]MCM8802763.1 zinc-dependent dehydrogenase [Candidatus Omnitrophota bacterium]
MKAAILKEIEKLVIEELKVPEPKNNEILIKVKSCAICGTDIKVFHHGHKHIVFPRITGHEVSGIVEKIGKNIKEFKEGDRVAIAPAIPCGRCYYCRKGQQTMCDNLKAIGYHYDGGFAEYMLVPEDAVLNGCVNKIPDTLSFEVACLAEPLACVINGQILSKIEIGDIVLIIGAGPIGILHSLLAKINGAGKIMLADISEERIKEAKFTDCYLIDMSKKDIYEEVKKNTDGHMADKVIVAVGSGKAQEISLKLVAKRGSINFFGGLPKENPYIQFDSNLLHYGEFFVVGTHGSTPLHNKIALELLSSGRIDAEKLITHKLPLERIIEGYQIVENKKGLKVLILP